MRSIIFTAALTLTTSAFADDAMMNALGQVAQAYSAQNSANNAAPANNNIGQIASALGANASTNSSLTTTPLLYSDAALKGMDCLNLELASTRIGNAVTNTKNNATDLLAAEKAAQGQTKSKASATADIAAMILAQRGGSTGEYAKMYQNMQGDPNATSNALDTEIKNLQSMNEQLSEIKVYQKYKNCPGSNTPVYVAPAPVTPTVTPVTPAVTPVTPATTSHKATVKKKKTVKKAVKKVSS